MHVSAVCAPASSANHLLLCARPSAGFEHVEEVVALVFADIGLVRGPDGVTARRFQQFTDLAMLGFSFAGAATSSCPDAGYCSTN